MSESIVLAVLGGSGLYDLPGLKDPRSIEVDTPYGKTSGPILVGTLDGHKIAFLARHGAGHRLTPTEVPYRANIFALKTLGVDRIVSVSACGSLRDELQPGQIVVPNQLYDHTTSRTRTYFGEGVVAHISAPNPFCPDLSTHLFEAVRAAGGTVHRGGSFITIEGPRFSTRVESVAYRSWGMDLIGMTTAPEAFLAREAEICYAVMAHITDYDVWHVDKAPVTVETVVQILQKNTRLAQDAIRQMLRNLGKKRSCDCGEALAGAIITRLDAIPKATLTKLGALIEKYASA